MLRHFLWPRRYGHGAAMSVTTRTACLLVLVLITQCISCTQGLEGKSPAPPSEERAGGIVTVSAPPPIPTSGAQPPISTSTFSDLALVLSFVDGRDCTTDVDCGTPDASCRSFKCKCRQFLPVPGTSRKFFTPPSLTCKQGLEAMSAWWLDSVRYTTVAIHLAIALWPAHQLVAVSFTFVRLSIAKGLFRLRVMIYVTVFAVCVGRIISYGFDPFGFLNVVPRALSRFNFTGATTSMFTAFTAFLLIWLRSVTHSHHVNFHASASGSCESSSSSAAAAAARHSHNDSRPPWWVTCSPFCRRRQNSSPSNPSSSQNPDHHDQQSWSHALALYWWCKFAFYVINALLWALELTFLFVLSEEDLSKITSIYAVGSMCLLVVVSALLVVGVNVITRRFEACQPPPLRLDDILLVPYKPGETSVLDVTVRARAQPVQPLPTRVARSCTAVMLISAIVRLLVSNPKIYPAGTADLWLGFQAVVRFIEAAALLLIMYGVAVTLDPLQDPRTPVSPTAMESSFAQHRMSKRPIRKVPPICPFLAMLKVGGRSVGALRQGTGSGSGLTCGSGQRRAGSGSPWELPTSPSGTPRALAPVHLTPVLGARNLGSNGLVSASSSGSGAGLPSAHTFEQQFLWAYGRHVSDTVSSPPTAAEPLARSPPPHHGIGPALGVRHAPAVLGASGTYVDSAAVARAATLATAAGALNVGSSQLHQSRHHRTNSGSGYHQRQTWIRPPAARLSESGTGSSGEADAGGPWSGRHGPVGW